MILTKPKMAFKSPADSVKELDRYVGEGWFLQIKYDGILATAHVVAGETEVKIFSRRGLHKTTIHLEVAPDFSAVLVGEYVGYSNWSQKSALKDHFVVFDCVELEGECVRELSFLDRNNHYRDACDLLCEKRIVPSTIHPITESALKFWLTWVEDNGYEGLVLKHPTKKWAEKGCGHKVKPIYDFDYVIMGFSQSKSKAHAGIRIKAVLCGLYVDGKLVRKLAVGGGLSNKDRRDMFLNPDSYIGKVARVKGWHLFSSGAMRHPSWIGLHEDKQPEECVWGTAEIVTDEDEDEDEYEEEED